MVVGLCLCYFLGSLEKSGNHTPALFKKRFITKVEQKN